MRDMRVVRREEPVAVSRGNEARMLFEAWFGLVWGGRWRERALGREVKAG